MQPRRGLVSRAGAASHPRIRSGAFRYRVQLSGVAAPGRAGRWRAPDLIGRQFAAEQVNRKWYGDGTEVVTDEGKLFLDSGWTWLAPHRRVRPG